MVKSPLRPQACHSCFFLPSHLPLAAIIEFSKPLGEILRSGLEGSSSPSLSSRIRESLARVSSWVLCISLVFHKLGISTWSSVQHPLPPSGNLNHLRLGGGVSGILSSSWGSHELTIPSFLQPFNKCSLKTTCARHLFGA